MTAGPGLTAPPSGSWSLDLHPHRHPSSAHTARWLRRGVAGTLIGLGLGVTALALSLPGEAPVPQPTGPVAGPSARAAHRSRPAGRSHPHRGTKSVGTAALSRPGGTP